MSSLQAPGSVGKGDSGGWSYTWRAGWSAIRPGGLLEVN